MQSNNNNNNNNNNGIMSVFDMVASHFLAEHHGGAVFFVAIVIGIIIVLGNRILDHVVPGAVDTAFDFYDRYIEPKILRRWNTNNTNSRSNNYNYSRRGGMEDEPLNSHASSVPVNNNSHSNCNCWNSKRSNTLPDEGRNHDTSYYCLPPHHLRQTIQSSAFHNMPRRNVRLVPPKETRGHRRPPICPIIVCDESEDSSGRSSSENTTAETIDRLGAQTTTTVNEDDYHIIMIDTTTVVPPPLLLPSLPDVEFLAPAPVLLLSTIASPAEGKVDMDEDEGSTTGEHYFFSLPCDFGDLKSSEINAVEGHEDVASLSYSESDDDKEENRYDSDDDDTVLLRGMFEEWDDFNVDEGHEDDVASLSYLESDEEVNSYNSDAEDSVLIGEVVFGELDGLNGSTTTLIDVANVNNAMNEPEEETDSSPPLLFAESTQVLLDEEVMIEDDGGSTTTAAEGGACCWNEAPTSSTAPLLGSIWVKHPKHGCMVRRSSRLIVLSRLG